MHEYEDMERKRLITPTHGLGNAGTISIHFVCLLLDFLYAEVE
jgi:hypothetical protein